MLDVKSARYRASSGDLCRRDPRERTTWHPASSPRVVCPLNDRGTISLERPGRKPGGDLSGAADVHACDRRTVGVGEPLATAAGAAAPARWRVPLLALPNRASRRRSPGAGRMTGVAQRERSCATAPSGISTCLIPLDPGRPLVHRHRLEAGHQCTDPHPRGPATPPGGRRDTSAGRRLRTRDRRPLSGLAHAPAGSGSPTSRCAHHRSWPRRSEASGCVEPPRADWQTEQILSARRCTPAAKGSRADRPLPTVPSGCVWFGDR